jgi:hypothetical protein
MNIRSYQNPLQKQVRDMPEPPPIQGDSWLDTLHRGIRALAPDAYRTGYRLLNGQYQGNPVLSAGADMNRVENWSPDPFPGGSAALGAVAGGLVNMGKKTYPNAFLHRAIGHEKELGHWNDIFQRGLSTQKPTSAITPSNPTTFMNRNAGLLFNAPDPKSIKWASPEDAASRVEFQSLHGGGSTERWVPGGGELRPEARVSDLDQLFDKQRNALQQTRPDRPSLHNEVVPELNRSMLAGVHIPLEDSSDPLVGALKTFAEQHKVPVYRFPVIQNAGDQLKALGSNPFAGKWGWKPGSKAYKTTNRLPALFGTKQLP